MTGFEEILQGMLALVPSNVDKREGSVIYDALAPCAFFLAQMYFQLENFIDLVLPDTALGEYLDRAVAAYGIRRKEATESVREIVTSAPVAMGTRWAVSGLVYVITEETGENLYEAKCETPGAVGNQYSGAMDPVSNVSGVTAEIGRVIIPGTDEETDDSLRGRFYARVQLPATSGNPYHYQQWALEVSGVGAAKVFPLDNGPGTVTILVVDENYEATGSLVEPVEEYIESVRPIGATVTVSVPEELQVNVTSNISLDGSRTLEEVKEDYKESLEQFLREMIFRTYRVSYAKTSSLLLDIEGVEDYDGFLLNGLAANITVGDKQIPVMGEVVLTEVSASGTD